MWAALRRGGVVPQGKNLQEQAWGLSRRMSGKSNWNTDEEILKLGEVEEVLNEVKAHDVRVIPVGEACSWADYMVLATGSSTWHVKNIAEAILYRAKKKQKEAPRKVLPSVQGWEAGKWIVIDSGNIMIHAFEEKARAYYDLEGRWASPKPFPATSTQDLAKAMIKVRPKNNSKKKPTLR